MTACSTSLVAAVCCLPTTPLAGRGPTDRDPKQLLEQTPLEELEGRVAETAWGVGLAGLTIARHLAAHAKVLPLGVAQRLLRVNDYVLALVPLLERPPWVLAAGGKVGQAGRDWTKTTHRHAVSLSALHTNCWVLSGHGAGIICLCQWLVFLLSLPSGPILHPAHPHRCVSGWTAPGGWCPPRIATCSPPGTPRPGWHSPSWWRTQPWPPSRTWADTGVTGRGGTGAGAG
jgi:hypothetical protein